MAFETVRSLARARLGALPRVSLPKLAKLPKVPGLPRLPRTPIVSHMRAVLVGAIEAFLNIGVFVAIALVFGIWSSWVMVERGSSLTTRTSGPWSVWLNAGRPDADPYTRAHFARLGSLPLSTSAVYTWEARTDEDGQRLHSSCEYALQGDGLNGDWWSLAVFDDRGSVIPNPANRYAFSASTIALGADGSYIVTLARDARPGNWLPTGGAGRLILVLTRPSPRPNAAPSEMAAADRGLPTIRRIACR
jgi:hypothetical protein